MINSERDKKVSVGWWVAFTCNYNLVTAILTKKSTWLSPFSFLVILQDNDKTHSCSICVTIIRWGNYMTGQRYSVPKGKGSWREHVKYLSTWEQAFSISKQPSNFHFITYYGFKNYTKTYLTNNKVYDDFPEMFLTTFQRLPKFLQNFHGAPTNVTKHESWTFLLTSKVTSLHVLLCAS